MKTVVKSLNFALYNFRNAKPNYFLLTSYFGGSFIKYIRLRSEPTNCLNMGIKRMNYGDKIMTLYIYGNFKMF